MMCADILDLKILKLLISFFCALSLVEGAVTRAGSEFDEVHVKQSKTNWSLLSEHTHTADAGSEAREQKKHCRMIQVLLLARFLDVAAACRNKKETGNIKYLGLWENLWPGSLIPAVKIMDTHFVSANFQELFMSLSHINSPPRLKQVVFLFWVNNQLGS